MQNRGYRESTHMEEMHIWRADNQLYSDSQLCRQLVPLTPHCSRVNYNLLHQGHPDCASRNSLGNFATVPCLGCTPEMRIVVCLGTHVLDAPLVGSDVRVQDHHTCAKCLPPVTSFSLQSGGGSSPWSPLDSQVKLQSCQCPQGWHSQYWAEMRVKLRFPFHFTLCPCYSLSRQCRHFWVLSVCSGVFLVKRTQTGRQMS